MLKFLCLYESPPLINIKFLLQGFLTSAWFTEDGTVVTAQSPSGLEQSCGIYIYILFFFFF